MTNEATEATTTTPAPVGTIKGIHVSITEAQDRWLVTGLSQGTETYRTAAEALSAIRDHATRMAEAGVSTAIRVEWQPTTEIGRVVVRALT